MSNVSEFDAKLFLKNATSRPGVYQMYNKNNEILYIGKAKNLKNRLTSYFGSNNSEKTKKLVTQIANIQLIITETETEALLLEGNLIKKYKPRYNILFRDDKSYPYIYAATRQEFPRLDFYRGARSLPGKYFGPFPSGHAVRETLNLLQKVFKLRSCNNTFFKNRSRPCLQYQIKRCSAPCVDYISAQDYQQDFQHALAFLEGKSEEILNDIKSKMDKAAKGLDYELAAKYRDQLIDLRNIQQKQYVERGKQNIDVVAVALGPGLASVYLLIIRGGRVLGNKTFFLKLNFNQQVTEIFESFFNQYYLAQQFNLPEMVVTEIDAYEKKLLTEACELRHQQPIKIQSASRGEKAKWYDLAKRNAEQALQLKLSSRKDYAEKYTELRAALGLKQELTRIECFDISHHRGEATVASCVVFGVEGPLNSQYRRFNINDVTPGDDYAAMREALTRRYLKIKKSAGLLPDLLLIDGGKGQLQQAIEVMEELQLNEITILAIAKGKTRKPGFETLFLSEKDNRIHLAADSAALHLLQQVRDEAHRFAITHNRNKLSKARQTSQLESIEGVGAKRRRALLNYFGGIQAVYQASVEQLAKVPGISLSLAKKIYDATHGN